jgi:hypothetical protein
MFCTLENENEAKLIRLNPIVNFVGTSRDSAAKNFIGKILFGVK